MKFIKLNIIKHLIGFLILISSSIICFAQNEPHSKVITGIFTYNPNTKWQKASISDMSIYDAFIGRYRSKGHYSERLKKNIYFILEHAWIDKEKTSLKQTLSYVIDGSNEEIVHSIGISSFDPLANRVFLIQTYASGNVSFGGLEKIDHQNGKRIARVYGVSKDGAINDIRDEFMVIDKSSWKNVMYSLNTNGQWEETYTDVFTKIIQENN